MVNTRQPWIQSTFVICYIVTGLCSSSPSAWCSFTTTPPSQTSRSTALAGQRLFFFFSAGQRPLLLLKLKRLHFKSGGSQTACKGGGKCPVEIWGTDMGSSLGRGFCSPLHRTGPSQCLHSNFQCPQALPSQLKLSPHRKRLPLGF